MRRAVLSVAVLILVCVLTLGAAGGHRASSPFTTFGSAPGFRTGYPSFWTQRLQSEQATIGTTIVWLSNQPMHDPCTATASGGVLRVTCGLPLASLTPGGILVVWSNTSGPTPPDASVFDQQLGRSIVVNGQPGKLRVSATTEAECGPIGATRLVEASFLVRGRTEYGMRACLRGPGIAAHEKELHKMLRATVFGTD